MPTYRNALGTCPKCNRRFLLFDNEPLCTECKPVHMRRSPWAPRTGRLNRREKQIIKLVIIAASNRMIASSLGLSQGTVKLYLHHLYRKLNVPNRTALAMWARDHESELA